MTILKSNMHKKGFVFPRDFPQSILNGEREREGKVYFGIFKKNPTSNSIIRTNNKHISEQIILTHLRQDFCPQFQLIFEVARTTRCHHRLFCLCKPSPPFQCQSNEAYINETWNKIFLPLLCPSARRRANECVGVYSTLACSYLLATL